MKKIGSCLLILAAIVCLLSGCSPMQKLMKDEACDHLFAEMMELVQNQDADAAYELLEPEVQGREFEAAFQQVVENFPEGEYTSQKVGKYTNWNDGEKTVQCTYQVDTADGKRYLVVVVRKADSQERIYSFHIQRQEKFFGTISQIAEFSGKQWAVFLIGIALMVPSWICAIDCLKRKVKLKPLWILLILLVYGGGLLYRTQNGMGFHAQLTLIQFSGLLLSDMGGFQLTLLFPVGSFAYLIFRKKITKEDESTENTAPPISKF